MQLTEVIDVAQRTNVLRSDSSYAKVYGSYTVLFGKFDVGMIDAKFSSM